QVGARRSAALRVPCAGPGSHARRGVAAGRRSRRGDQAARRHAADDPRARPRKDGQVSDDNAITLPCGCTRGIVKRMAPALNPDGTAKIEGGAFVMEEVEEIQERFCDEHTLTMIRRQYDVQK